MNALLQNLAPTFVAFLLVGWCAWPEGPWTSLSPTPSASSDGLSPKLSRAALTPEIAASWSRDPFQVATPRAPSAGASDPRGVSPVLERADAAPQENRADANSLPAIPMLHLGATYLRGTQQLALINGRVYKPGDALSTEPKATEPWTVHGIRRDQVILKTSDRVFVLTYSGLQNSSQTNGFWRRLVLPWLAAQHATAQHTGPAAPTSTAQGG